MSSRIAMYFISAATICAACSATIAQVVWDESLDGDLSSDRNSPTNFALGIGSHSLLATTGGGDLEYISISLAPHIRLSQLMLISYEGVDGRAFAAVQAGPTFTEPPSGPNVANLLGWTHFGHGSGNVGTDILDDMGAGPGAIGFTPPLQPGTYSFWLQQLSAPVTYQLDFVVIPTPCTLVIAPAACLFLARRPGRR